MGNPFRDQFIKAGLVSRKQAHKADIEQRTQQKAQRKKPGEVQVVRTVELAQQEKKERARQSNARRDLAAQEKAITAQIKELAARHGVQTGKGGIAFHFADTNKIKKIYLPKALIDQLSNGTLGIVKVGEKYEIVPAETAVKIRDRRPEALLVLNVRQEIDPSDPYAEFPIPDDYEW